MTVRVTFILLVLLLSCFEFACSPKGHKLDRLACADGFVLVISECASSEDYCVAGKVCLRTMDTCIGEKSIEHCIARQVSRQEVCDGGLKCVDGKCVDACHNGRLDAGEEATDCGGACAPCIACRVHADCGEHGFCDSASGYVCSKRSRSDKDCSNNALWDGDYCRGDGRCSPKVFETVWEVTADDPTVVLPFDVHCLGAACNFQILWGDEATGTDITTLTPMTDCAMVENRTHTYSGAGRYHVKIIGTYDGWGAFDAIKTYNRQFTPPASRLRSVLSFGPVGLCSKAFYSADKLEIIPKKDIPDASKLKSLAYSFLGADIFNAPIGHWDTSQVTDMSGVFAYVRSFNQPIGSWDTSQVLDMREMFQVNEVFNQPIGDWDTSSVIHMAELFNRASAFNQPIGSWNTSHVTNMVGMFKMALAFDQPIGAWDTSRVTDMSEMFNGTKVFNRPIDAWNVSNVTLMELMFMDSVFNQPLGKWNVSNVIHMYRMFKSSVFDQSLVTWNLKAGVKQFNMFQESAMSNRHLCGLKAVGGEWLELPEVSDAVCEGD